ncbi:ribonuclease HII [Psychrobacter sp.]|uniref:ribonuclease HII n=1 Tax=Psychrobacter sp. TaxID=56811 RepID=UPI00264A1575|nr:ribonuclease HII [Psychrobacter sp.]MDN6276491.1 ribonuclease HII [Psychrobacter sp.]MDN6308837.1 ribonuclease HII [Psychrobacter sp.]
MSNAFNNENDYLPINRCIEEIDIKGQYMQLAAPIRLTGWLNIPELRTQYLTQTDASVPSPVQIGIDEAGRGPLLGSVNVAAAILPAAWSGLIEDEPLKQTPLSVLTDSKKLSEKKRDMLYPLVRQHAIGHIVADVPAAVIDQVNILQATMLGMRLCSEVLLETIVTASAQYFHSERENIFEVLFDGNRCPDIDYDKFDKLGVKASAIDCQAWVKGDARHTSIAAASILAKVSRDKTMYALDAQHPEYGIAKHKGYPTRAHMEAIASLGVLSEHRRSFAPVRKALES